MAKIIIKTEAAATVTIPVYLVGADVESSLSDVVVTVDGVECEASVDDNLVEVAIAAQEAGEHRLRLYVTYNSEESVIDYELQAKSSGSDNVTAPPAYITVTPAGGGGGGGDDVAKQGTNPDATLTETQAQATSAANDAAAAKAAAETLTGLDSDITAGKAAIATAISGKGVQSSASDTLLQMADEIDLISQEPITINGGDMYAEQLFGNTATPKLHNLYEVMATLISAGTFLEYKGILLGSYNKGYNSLALAGAGTGGAYMTSDGAIYYEDGTHTWNDYGDGYADRWVAFFFGTEYHSFEITNSSICPREIVVGRKVGVIKNLVNGRISAVHCFANSEYRGFNSNSCTNNWNRNLVFRGINATEDTGFMIYNNTTVENIYLQGSSVRGRVLNTASNSNNLSSLIIDSRLPYCDLGACPSGATLPLQEIYVVNAEGGKIFGNYTAYNIGDYQFNLNKLRRLMLIDVEGLTVGCSSQSVATWASNFTYIYIGYKSNDRTKSVIFSGNYGYSENNNFLRYVTCVELKDGWVKPLNVDWARALTEENIVTYILNRLGTNTGAALTITLGATNLAKLTDEEKAIATNKGFTLA